MTASLDAFAMMQKAWNTPDEAVVRACAAGALTPDVEFVDPAYDIRGRDAWVDMVLAFHRKHPGAILLRTSGIDQHHDRARYAWSVKFADGRVLDGFDAVAIDTPSRQIRRIDGFFGPLPPL